jgi:hypothetical protein
LLFILSLDYNFYYYVPLSGEAIAVHNSVEDEAIEASLCWAGEEDVPTGLKHPAQLGPTAPRALGHPPQEPREPGGRAHPVAKPIADCTVAGH